MKMKPLLFILFIFYSIFAFAQKDTIFWNESDTQTVSRKYADGYHVFKKNGKITREGAFVEGNLTGTWKYYYDDGKLKLITDKKFKYNLSDDGGQYKEFYETGQLKLDGKYLIVDSLECLNCFELFDNKQITRANGRSMRVGVWTEFYENGKIKSTGVYSKAIHETYSSITPKDYGKTGSPVFIPGCYSEDYLKDKEWKYYNEKEELIKEEYYFNGILTGFNIYEH